MMLMRRPPAHSPRLLSSLFVPALLLASASGCESTGGYPESQPPSASGYSSSVGSSIGSSSFGGASFSAPQRAAASGDLVVRPDVITIVFAIKAEKGDPEKAITSLERFTAAILERFQEATAGAASMKMCGASVRPTGGTSKSDDRDAVEYAVVADGSIEVKLAKEQDYWARSRLLAAITRASRDLAAPPKKEGEKKGEEAAPLVHFNEPQVTVKDVEAYRPKLMERWAKRARELGDAVQAAAAPLYVVDCAPPSPIEQRLISLEEVALVLPVTCRVDALRTPASPGARP